MSDTDFAALMGPVASHADMWGPPSKGLSTTTVLRWGGPTKVARHG